MARIRTSGDGPKCVVCGKPAVWSGYCKMEDGKGYCDSGPPDIPAVRKPTDQEMREYQIKINRLISVAEQLRETVYNEMMAITAQVFDPNAMPVVMANTLLSDYFDQHPIPPDAPWQEKAIRLMATLVNSEMMLEIERRHGDYLGAENKEEPT